jgi:hypothetical protein
VVPRQPVANVAYPMSKSLKHQIVNRAFELVSDERTWTRASMARTGDNRPCSCTSPEAVRFCALGAIYRAAFELTGQQDATLVQAAVREVCDYVQLPYINDMNGRLRVVELFRNALVAATKFAAGDSRSRLSAVAADVPTCSPL